MLPPGPDPLKAPRPFPSFAESVAVFAAAVGRGVVYWKVSRSTPAHPYDRSWASIQSTASRLRFVPCLRSPNPLSASTVVL